MARVVVNHLQDFLLHPHHSIVKSLALELLLLLFGLLPLLSFLPFPFHLQVLLFLQNLLWLRFALYFHYVEDRRLMDLHGRNFMDLISYTFLVLWFFLHIIICIMEAVLFNLDNRRLWYSTLI